MSLSKHSLEEEVRSVVPSVRSPAGGVPYRNKAWTQLWLVSFCCFCLPGMYNAIQGLGGSGQLDPTVGANSSVALLSVGAATGLLVGQPMYDLLGNRCMALGAWTYPLFTASLLAYSHGCAKDGAFVIASGAVLGLGATLLWVTQGACMLSYPLPGQKGRSIAGFWVVFNLGGAIGSFISLGLNYHRHHSGTVSDGTYIAFMVIMVFGWALSAFLLPPHLVIRTDGSRAAPLPSHPNSHPVSLSSLSPPTATSRLRHWYAVFASTARREFAQILKLRHEPRLLFLLPLCFGANFFYSYQQNIVNGGSFTLRSRSLNSALYWGAQMLGGVLIGLLLDLPPLSRRGRALLGWGAVFVLGNVAMGGGLAYQRWFEAEAHKRQRLRFIDFSDARTFAGPCILYITYGALDAAWQGLAYWLLGAMCDRPRDAARFVGVYKSLQCVGGAVAFRLTASHVAPMRQFAANWGVIAGALLFALPAVCRITEPENEDEMELFEAAQVPQVSELAQVTPQTQVKRKDGD